MSTDYYTEKLVRARELMERLAPYGITEHKRDPNCIEAKSQRALGVYGYYLTDGQNTVWASVTQKPDLSRGDYLHHLNCTMGNDPERILEAIAQAFETEIYSEHQLSYEEPGSWDAQREEYQREHYEELIRLATNGVPTSGLEPRVVRQAEIARDLIDSRPELLAPAHKDKLLDLVYETYLP